MKTNDQSQAYTDPKEGEVPDNNSKAASEGEVRAGDKALDELECFHSWRFAGVGQHYCRVCGKLEPSSTLGLMHKTRFAF